MEPIISPWIIYAIEIIPNVAKTMGCFAAILLILTLSILIIRFIISGTEITENLERATRYSDLESRLDAIEKELKEKDFSESNKINRILYSLDYIKEDYRDKLHWYLEADKFTLSIISLSKYCKSMIITAFILIIITTFIPSRETIYKMFIASYITPDNINTGVEIGKNSAEYIVKLITDAIIKIKEASGN